MLWQSRFPDMFIVFSTTTQPNTDYTISFWFTYLGRDHLSLFQYTCVQVSAHLQENNDKNSKTPFFPLTRGRYCFHNEGTKLWTVWYSTGTSDTCKSTSLPSPSFFSSCRRANKNITAKILHFEKEFATVHLNHVVQGCIHLFSS